MEKRNALTVVDNAIGVDLVARELLRALIESRPDRLELMQHALKNATQLRETLIATTQTEATIRGLEQGIEMWQGLMETWPEANTPPR